MCQGLSGRCAVGLPLPLVRESGWRLGASGLLRGRRRGCVREGPARAARPNTGRLPFIRHRDGTRLYRRRAARGHRQRLRRDVCWPNARSVDKPHEGHAGLWGDVHEPPPSPVITPPGAQHARAPAPRHLLADRLQRSGHRRTPSPVKSASTWPLSSTAGAVRRSTMTGLRIGSPDRPPPTCSA